MLLKFVLLPLVAGSLGASMTMYGIVWSQTQVPDTNPVSTPILTYGDQS